MTIPNQITQPIDQADLANPPLPPAVDLPLTGKHLIEASAGTGKTWTLTGVVLRLIVEGGQPCERIIATTFTRSAAAEMRQRIRERLQDFYRVVQLVRSHALVLPSASVQSEQTSDTPTNQPPNDNHNDNGKLTLTADQQAAVEVFFAQLMALAEQHQLKDQLSDPINTHLIRWLAGHVVSQPKPAVDFRIAYQRTVTAINQLDRLFVGTLDSLCQKWLREFSSDTGFSPDIQIRDDVNDIMLGMIHDQLRAFLAQIYQNAPTLARILQAKNKLANPKDYLAVVDQAQTFYTAQIDELPFPAVPTDLDKSLILMQKIATADDSELRPYINQAFRNQQGMTKNRIVSTQFEQYLYLKQKFTHASIEDLFDLNESDDAYKWLKGLHEVFEYDKHFNKPYTQQREAFKQIQLLQWFDELYVWLINTKKYLEQIAQYFTQFISRYVREQLPNVLEAQRLTTYSLQLARLNHALAGEQGLQLARYIRHQYPNALIDESQDLNTEQALMIQRIYLDSHDTPANHADLSRQNARQAAGFLLLVGDPKQAIYGFRGGDVYNYNALKRLFPNQPMTLMQNRRSTKSLIDALNVWFGAPTPTTVKETQARLTNGDFQALTSQRFYLGSEIYYQHIQATRDTPELTLAAADDVELPTLYHLQILQQDNNQKTGNQDINAANTPQTEQQASENAQNELTEAQVIAAQIAALLSQGQDGRPLALDGKPLSPSDICVLAKKNNDLTAVERELTKRGIASVRGGDRSVFADRMAKDLLTLMHAMLVPYQHAKINALLLTVFFQLTIQQAQAVFNDNKAEDEPSASTTTSAPTGDAAHIQTILANSSKLWQRQGFLAAVQWLLTQIALPSDEQPMNFWQKLASHRDGERLLLDLRQLLDIINEQGGEQQANDYQLLDWMHQMISTPPKDDWAKQHTLASQQGVQLMTMHGSKGLEFAIVFVAGISGQIGTTNKKDKHTLYRYDAYDIDPTTDRSKIGLQGRRLSASPQHTDSQTDLVAISKQQMREDGLRLLYVALTRARERLYLVTSFNKKTVSENDYILKAFVKDVKTLSLHDDLQPFVKHVDIKTLYPFLTKTYRYHAPKDDSPARQVIDYSIQQADFEQAFQGWANTSFSALAKFLDHNQQDAAINANELEKGGDDHDKLGDNGNHQSNGSIARAALSPDAPMRFRFDKGVNAGTFLHHVLEDIAQYYHEVPSNDIANNDNAQQELFKSTRWAAMIDRALRNQQMPAKYFSTLAASYQPVRYDGLIEAPQADYIQLSQWLFDIIHTPFGATGQSLVAIDGKHKIAEMGFSLRLKNHLSTNTLNQLLAKHNVALHLQGQGNPNAIWRYLRGEIDLVYQHNNEFYVVDYKSNFLGTSLDAYNQSAMMQEMNKHGYWLQACIYQVALHRFLKLRLPNYDITKHLGVVEYVFLRGMSRENNHTGKLIWRPDVELIQELDETFGTF